MQNQGKEKSPEGNKPQILHTQDVADRLGIGINQTRALIKRKDFPKITIGKCTWLIPEDEFEEWIHRSLYKHYDLDN